MAVQVRVRVRLRVEVRVGLLVEGEGEGERLGSSVSLARNCFAGSLTALTESSPSINTGEGWVLVLGLGSSVSVSVGC